MRRDGMLVENIGDLAGLARTHPTMAFFLAMLLFSLAGIPPLAGFFAKFYVFLAAIKAGLYHAGRDRRARQRGGRLLLSGDRQDHVFRRAGEEASSPCRAACALVLGVSGLLNILFFAYPAPLLGARRRLARAKSRVLNFTRKMNEPRSHGPGGGPAHCLRHARLDQCRGAGACARRRARAVVDHRADARSAGRGRRGNTWVSPPGNLYATLLLTEPSPPRTRRNCRSWRRWRCTTRSANARRSSARPCR